MTLEQITRYRDAADDEQGPQSQVFALFVIAEQLAILNKRFDSCIAVDIENVPSGLVRSARGGE